MSRKEPVFRARGLRVGYAEDAPVCAPVDLDVRPRDMVAIIGANGSGKSTLLRTLLGALAPLGGTSTAFGRPIDERDRDFRARVAGVLDEDAYFPGLTVREHLVLTSRGHAVPDAGPLADEMLERFGLTGHRNALPSELSSGQRRRLLLSAAFVRPRDVLVLDEPEQRLDPGMRSRLADLLRDEIADGGTVVMATHDAELLAATGARGLFVADDSCRKLDPRAAAQALETLR